MSFNPNLDMGTIKESNTGLIYPVYISSRVVKELVDFCKSTVPKEALGFLLGLRVQYKEDPRIEFTKITDWVTGSVESTHVSANFTTEGLEQANRFLDDKYGKEREKYDEIPKIVGIVHSHPFNLEPEFSTTDLTTFLNFPYDAEGNVFILIDPIPQDPYFKVFKIIVKNSVKTLQHVPWIEYSYIESDFKSTTTPLKEKEEKGELSEDADSSQNQQEEDRFTPPKIEKIKSNSKSKSKTKKVNLREFF